MTQSLCYLAVLSAVAQGLCHDSWIYLEADAVDKERRRLPVSVGLATSSDSAGLPWLLLDESRC